MNISQLRYLVAVAEERHFGRAADRCYVSQPTLSTQIKKLEEELGVALFERTNRSVDVTHAGEDAVRVARRILSEVQAMKDLGRRGAATLSGPMRIGIIPTLCPYLLPWLVPALRRDFPALDLQVVEELTDHILAALDAHRLECALLALPVDMPGTVSLPLFDEPFRVACPADHALARAEAISLRDLRSERLLYVAEGHCLRDQTLALCAEDGGIHGNRDEAFRGASLETLRRMVAAGIGFTLMPVLAIDREDGGDGILCRPFLGPASRRIGLVFRKSWPRAEDMRALARAIVSCLPLSVAPVAPD